MANLQDCLDVSSASTRQSSSPPRLVCLTATVPAVPPGHSCPNWPLPQVRIDLGIQQLEQAQSADNGALSRSKTTFLTGSGQQQGWVQSVTPGCYLQNLAIEDRVAHLFKGQELTLRLPEDPRIPVLQDREYVKGVLDTQFNGLYVTIATIEGCRIFRDAPKTRLRLARLAKKAGVICLLSLSTMLY